MKNSNMKNWVFSRNIFVVLAYRILLIMVLFSLCRIGFFLFNLKMFPGVTIRQFLTMLKGGLTFDISAVVYINMIFILLHIIPLEVRYNDVYQTVLKYIFFITNGIAIAMNGMDFVYYRFVDKRATSDVFQTFAHDSNNTKVFFRFLTDYWPATLFTIAIWISDGLSCTTRLKLKNPRMSIKLDIIL